MHKLARLLACSAVLATVALSAPGTALAVPRLKDPINGSFPPGGTWISQNYNKTESGSDVHYEPGDKVVDGLCMQVYGSHSRAPLSREVCVEKNPTTSVTKPTTLATDTEVPTGTEFFIMATKQGNDSRNDFKGWLYH